MARLNAEPAAEFGALLVSGRVTYSDKPAGTAYARSGSGCCASTTEQLLYFSNTAAFSTSGIKT